MPVSRYVPLTERSRRFNGRVPTLDPGQSLGNPMSRFESLSGRALEIAGNVGDTLRNNVPDRAMKWIGTGAALGALRTGGRTATKFVRRNPAVTVAMAAGAGLLLYAVRRQQKKRHEGAIEGKSTRIEAKKGAAAKPRARAAAKRARKAASERATTPREP